MTLGEMWVIGVTSFRSQGVWRDRPFLNASGILLKHGREKPVADAMPGRKAGEVRENRIR